MRPAEQKLFDEINNKLISFNSIRSLPGISTSENRICLSLQIIDSIRRIKYVTTIRDKENTPPSITAKKGVFDPIKAAAWYKKEDEIDEACWLIFLATHFGKNKKTGWNLVRDIYCGLSDSPVWTWQNASTNPALLNQWLADNYSELLTRGKFGNHRKFESLRADANLGTGKILESYIDWVKKDNTHVLKFKTVCNSNNAQNNFHSLYNSMDDVKRFGRTGRFDYLTMLGKFDLVNIVPGATYMGGATGPLDGARLLFGGDKKANIKRKELEKYFTELEQHLGLYFGMQVIEDAICNWQKNPSKYIHFRG